MPAQPPSAGAAHAPGAAGQDAVLIRDTVLSTVQVCFCQEGKEGPTSSPEGSAEVWTWEPKVPRTRSLGSSAAHSTQPHRVTTPQKGKRAAEGPAGRKGAESPRQIGAAGGDAVTAAPHGACRCWRCQEGKSEKKTREEKDWKVLSCLRKEEEVASAEEKELPGCGACADGGGWGQCRPAGAGLLHHSPSQRPCLWPLAPAAGGSFSPRPLPPPHRQAESLLLCSQTTVLAPRIASGPCH